MFQDPIITTVRMEQKTKDLVSRVSEQREETPSSFIRRAILKELARLGQIPEDQTKALGIEAEQTGDEVAETTE